MGAGLSESQKYPRANKSRILSLKGQGEGKLTRGQREQLKLEKRATQQASREAAKEINTHFTLLPPSNLPQCLPLTDKGQGASQDTEPNGKRWRINGQGETNEKYPVQSPNPNCSPKSTFARLNSLSWFYDWSKGGICQTLYYLIQHHLDRFWIVIRCLSRSTWSGIPRCSRHQPG